MFWIHSIWLSYFRKWHSVCLTSDLGPQSYSLCSILNSPLVKPFDETFLYEYLIRTTVPTFVRCSIWTRYFDSHPKNHTRRERTSNMVNHVANSERTVYIHVWGARYEPARSYVLLISISFHYVDRHVPAGFDPRAQLTSSTITPYGWRFYNGY